MSERAMTESTGKMRDWIIALTEHDFSWKRVQGLDILDGIEREIAERYVELPVDADGVPIHELDTLYDRDGKEFLVTTLVMDGGWTVSSWGKPGRPQNYRHVKPRTVEDILREFAQGVSGQNADFADLAAKQYAEEIRELLEVE